MSRTYADHDLKWLEANNFTFDETEEGRWNGLYVPEGVGAVSSSAEFFDLQQAVDGTWIAAKYIHWQDQLDWSNAGLGFKMAKDAYIDAELRGWGTIAEATDFENPCPDNPTFCKLYDMGFLYTGEGDWVIKIDEYVTGYMHYRGPDVSVEACVTDTPEWQPQVNGGEAGPRYPDPVSAAVWIKLEAAAHGY
jgi:hypothetical protein